MKLKILVEGSVGSRCDPARTLTGDTVRHCSRKRSNHCDSRGGRVLAVAVATNTGMVSTAARA
jgi:hypothetical protein